MNHQGTPGHFIDQRPLQVFPMPCSAASAEPGALETPEGYGVHPPRALAAPVQAGLVVDLA